MKIKAYIINLLLKERERKRNKSTIFLTQNKCSNKWRPTSGTLETVRMIPLEELLNAPVLPKNLPHFEIIKECEKAIILDYEKWRWEGTVKATQEEEEEEEIEEVFLCECRYDEHAIIWRLRHVDPVPIA